MAKPYERRTTPVFVASRDDVRLEDCAFYHTMDLPGYGLVKGEWDLRGKEREYLGSYNFAGASVIEFGPASGGLTFFIDRECARIVSFEVADDGHIDILPLATRDYAGEVAFSRFMGRQIKNSWMLARKAFASKARACYGDIYRIPPDIGHYDVGVFAAILLHLRDRFGALRAGAEHIKNAVIVTDVLRPGCESETESLMRFSPGGESSVLYWWDLSPGAVVRMLQLVGFPRIEITYHRQRIYAMTEQYVRREPVAAGDVQLYTVVGRR
jgi:hypothetical protein